MNNEIRELYEEFSHAFMTAEAAAKKYELENAEIMVPAINQLRYAGHHIAKSLLIDADKTIQVQKADQSLQACLL